MSSIIDDKCVCDLICEAAKTENIVYVSQDVWIFIYSSFMEKHWRNAPIEPAPPILSKKTWYGFFSSGQEITYDYHSPKYLEELEQYKKSLEFWKNRTQEINHTNELDYITPFKTVKVRLQMSSI